MEESIFDITLKIRAQKKIMTKNQVKDFVRIFVVKLFGLKTGNHFLK